jgi:RNA-directed DNA polymerase
MISHSFDNFLLSWKRVTTSQGFKTAGVDKKKWKHKNFSNFMSAYRIWKWKLRPCQPKNTHEIKPLRRIYIPKADGSQRPLGIPTISDRFVQAIFTPAIEVINEVLVYKYKCAELVKM